MGAIGDWEKRRKAAAEAKRAEQEKSEMISDIVRKAQLEDSKRMASLTGDEYPTGGVLDLFGLRGRVSANKKFGRTEGLEGTGEGSGSLR